MKDLSSQITGLKKKAKQLVENYQSVKKENNKLKEEVDRLVKNLDEKNQQVMELTNKVNVLKISGSVGNESTKDVKLKINELVREIDSCIAQINK
ncbi:hypothetical protein FRY74_07785 [Vicingus serpentipes]|jgi:uncharacterized coiled-coil DUF342 family protein|uniref:Uncharacterized protein n=1 Tax=Vicingus serpentipes TaxID=1926625 RepID=A0A5C6RSS9_9FLAO|nr:hypothetical protein [Vicingus serpentipes]TXB65313.1 hypothetical protein FRY74_07785 [Vicingus serpentipes]